MPFVIARRLCRPFACSWLAMVPASSEVGRVTSLARIREILFGHLFLGVFCSPTKPAGIFSKAVILPFSTPPEEAQHSACPQEGSVSGEITAANVIAGATARQHSRLVVTWPPWSPPSGRARPTERPYDSRHGALQPRIAALAPAATQTNGLIP